MKKQLLFLLLGIWCLFFNLTSCKSKKDSGFSDQINEVVPKWAIDTMRKNGMILHEGKNPPSFEGFFFQSPNHLESSNLPRDKKGDVYSDYTYQFLNQNNKNLTIDIKGKSKSGGDIFTGAGAFISGKGNYFTVFLEVEGTTNKNYSESTYKAFHVYSGEITSTGINNLQNSLIMIEKDDPDDILIEVGGCRVFIDADYFSERTSGFRMLHKVSENLPTQVMAVK